ncbi:hypothetical protein GCM10023321_11350 [Pseudonocardia eucalypti]|uniref:Uncharacterized protein n=1 Tax=Pseudonocardia eucalypti TaxID=648755 RepID=A0ABP9PNL9_9PSEU|nr:hypothetical protein [Pseudonocardia eucalypti]
MLNLSVLYKAPVESLPSIVATGLLPETPDKETQQTNQYLDQWRPAELVDQVPQRQKSIYCYLGINGCVLDVDSGELVRQSHWQAGPGTVRLRLVTPPETAFVSDLTAYDQVRSHLARDRSDPRLPTLARRYWFRLLNAAVVRDHYRIDQGAIVAAPSCPPGLPKHLRRVEVLLASKVGSTDIQTLSGRPIMA